jgi:hypothetical protein
MGRPCGNNEKHRFPKILHSLRSLRMEHEKDDLRKDGATSNRNSLLESEQTGKSDP